MSLPTYLRRRTRSKGLHQRGRDIFARHLKALPKQERHAAHDAFDIRPHRYDTTNYSVTHPALCLRFAVMHGGVW